MSRTERILRLMEEGTMTGCGVREAIAATGERKIEGAIRKHEWEADPYSPVIVDVALTVLYFISEALIRSIGS